MFSDVGVRDDGAASAEFQPRALVAQTRQKTSANFDGVAAMTKRDMNGAHRTRIEAGTRVSKVWRAGKCLNRTFQSSADKLDPAVKALKPCGKTAD